MPDPSSRENAQSSAKKSVVVRMGLDDIVRLRELSDRLTQPRSTVLREAARLGMAILEKDPSQFGATRGEKGVVTRVQEILAFLDSKRLRATYRAVAESVGTSARQLSTLLGNRTPKTSWVVSARDWLPTGFSIDEQHPELTSNPFVVTSGKDLKRYMTDAERQARPSPEPLSRTPEPREVAKDGPRQTERHAPPGRATFTWNGSARWIPRDIDVEDGPYPVLSRHLIDLLGMLDLLDGLDLVANRRLPLAYTYGEVARATKIESAIALVQCLGKLQRWCLDQDCFDLSALVVSKSSRQPGRGHFRGETKNGPEWRDYLHLACQANAANL